MNQPTLIAASGDSIRESFGRQLAVEGISRESLLVLDADVAGGTGAHHFRKDFGERFIQCGIAEQNMVGGASGLAASGYLPVVTTFAAFFLRTIDQVRLSIAYANRNVKLVGSHAGLDVGPDGASAQCLEDIAVFRAIPNMTVIVPSGPSEARLATSAILDHIGPLYMRTGRSPVDEKAEGLDSFQIGKALQLRPGFDLTIAACGPLLFEAIEASDLLAKEGIGARVLNISTIKPIDRDAIVTAARETGLIISIEDHNVLGGLGSAIAECSSEAHPVRVVRLGVADVFGESGNPKELYRKNGLTATDIVAAARKADNHDES